jgi:hypothetical protein
VAHNHTSLRASSEITKFIWHCNVFFLLGCIILLNFETEVQNSLYLLPSRRIANEQLSWSSSRLILTFTNSLSTKEMLCHCKISRYIVAFRNIEHGIKYQNLESTRKRLDISCFIEFGKHILGWPSEFSLLYDNFS